MVSSTSDYEREAAEPAACARALLPSSDSDEASLVVHASSMSLDGVSISVVQDEAARTPCRKRPRRLSR